MAGGRPTDYDPKYCQTVIDLGNEGASVVEMAATIGVARNTLETQWTAAHPEFLEALTQARQLSQVWWEKKGRENLLTPQGVTFQASMWSRSMAARFPADWRESTKVEQEITGKGGAPLIAVEFIKAKDGANE